MNELSRDLLAVLACPACKGGLDYSPENKTLACNACRLVFPVRGGIPVMLVEEAAAPTFLK